MKFSTAISFVFAGITLYYMARMQQGKTRIAEIALPAAALVMSLFMSSILLSVFTGITTGVESLFIKEQQGAVQTPVAGRPSIPTMVSFILIIMSSAFLLHGYIKSNKIIQGAAFVIIPIAGIGLIGYVVDYPVLYYATEWNTGIAIHTAILFIILGVGLLLLSKQKQDSETIDTLKIKTKMVFLLLVFSIIPIIFVAAWNYDISRSLIEPSEVSKRYVIIALVTISTIAIFAFIIAERTVRPILKLSEVTNVITKGEQTIKADERSNDEIGELAKSFNGMLTNIRLNEKLKEEAMQEVAKQKEEFSAMITHELKTPLVSIQGYSELFLDGTMGDMTQEQKDTMKVMYDNSIHLRQTIDDILDAHKLELGRLKLNIDMVSTKDLVDTCVQTFKLQAESKGVLLDGKYDDIMVRCDRRRIIQVLNNLVSNALKFVPEKTGRIQIACQKQDETATFSVKDNGIGIPQEKQKSMFKKFYQVDTSLGRKAGGTGLGLAISKGIVDVHKGNMWLESSEGNGTVLYFTLPLVRR